MISFRGSTGTVGSAASIRNMAKSLDMVPPISVRKLIVTKEITDFYRTSFGALVVGSPIGPVRSLGIGDYQQLYSFGSIVKPANAFPDVGDRFHVSVTLAGVRCFGTDDPGFVLIDPDATDEPFLITTVFAVDPREKDKSTVTTRIGPEGVGEVAKGDVFGQNRDLVVDIAVPGDSDIAVNVELFDQELITNPEKAAKAISDAHTALLLAGVATLTAFVPPAGAVAAAAVAVLKASGLLDEFSDGIGSVIANSFADDHLGSVNLRISNTFLKTLRDNPRSLDRTSDAIGGETYNFPQLPEDDSEAGRSWMFREEGKGTYRPFFRVVLTEP
jgi:hypothetical protein